MIGTRAPREVHAPFVTNHIEVVVRILRRCLRRKARAWDHAARLDDGDRVSSKLHFWLVGGRASVFATAVRARPRRRASGEEDQGDVSHRPIMALKWEVRAEIRAHVAKHLSAVVEGNDGVDEYVGDGSRVVGNE